MTTTYVYENNEVKLTGRQANRELSSGKIETLLEITPTNSHVGNWKKWVHKKQLFEVETTEDKGEE